MDEQRGFKCRVYEGTYNGEFTVWVKAESIEAFGNYAIEQQAIAEIAAAQLASEGER